MNEEMIIEIMRNVSKDSIDLESQYAEIKAALDSVYVPQYQQQYSATNAKYLTFMSKLDKIIRQLQQALAQVQGEQEPPEIPPPSPPRQLVIHKSPPPEIAEPPKIILHPPNKMFEIFTSREMPICEAPYPPLCGSLPAAKGERIPIDGFVAVKLDQEFALYYVVGYEDNDYLVCDVTADPATVLRKRPHDILALPTSLPARSTSRVEYAVGTKVLALWPEQSDEWTSTFYPAKVVQPPSKRDWGYALKFEEDNDYDWVEVPSQFVISFPRR